MNDIQDFTTKSLNAAAVTGTWRLMTIVGLSRSAHVAAFDSGTWALVRREGRAGGSDGCNKLAGTYRFGAQGAAIFSVVGTKRRCLQITPREPLQ